MTNLPPSVLRARILLRSLEASPGAETRVYDRILAQPQRRASGALRWAFAALAICCAGSSAYALGYVPVQRWFAQQPASAVMEPRLTEKRPTRKLMPHAAVVPPSTAETAHSSEGAATAKDVEVVPAGDSASPSAAVVEHAQLATAAPTTSAAAVDPASASVVSGATPKVRAATPGAALNTAAPPTLPESELSIQVSKYRAAIERLPQDPVAALAQLEAHRLAWPKSAIRHEVDLRIIMTLLAVGRASDAQREAQRFVANYPNSPQRLAVGRIADAGAQHDPNHDD